MGRRFARLEQLVQRKAIEKGAQKEKHFRRVNKFKFKFAGVIEPRTDKGCDPVTLRASANEIEECSSSCSLSSALSASSFPPQSGRGHEGPSPKSLDSDENFKP